MPPEPEAQVSLHSPLLAISATFTSEPLAEYLKFWMKELCFEYQVRFAPYNQVFQQLLDRSSMVAGNRDGINIFLVRLEDWVRFKPNASLAELETDFSQVIDLIESAARSSATPLILGICPDSPGFAAAAGRAALARRMKSFAVERLRELTTVQVFTDRDVEELYPVPDIHDPHGDELGHVPYTPAYFAALGNMLARRIHALRVAPYKVIALDCDDTLWAGICGEDGPEGVVLDAPRHALHEFLLAQRDAGMLLCLASKNNLEDVEETFRVHPEMPLRPEHFIARRINWDPKPKNLASLAAELELGLDSFIFIDDNIKESSEVQANCPDVLTLTLPADAEEIPAFLKHVWAFDRLRITEEDRQRNEQYAQRLERGRAARQAASIEEFLASLQLEVRIAPMTPDQLPRVSQLTYRTNQMNFSTVRRSEGEIRELVNSGAAECLTVHVSDRFGAYGLTGAMLYSTDGEKLTIDTFLLSCRALGRGVEHRMMARLGEIALERGLRYVEAPFRRTQRNAPALLFLESVAGAAGSEMFVIPAAQAAAVVYKPNGGPRAIEGGLGARRSARPCPTEQRIDYERIARDLALPGAVLDQVRGTPRPRPLNGRAAVAPRTDLEARLARIWADTLGVSAVGVNDNFFDLGGHSLLAVELLSRVRKELGIELSLEVVYSGTFTVAELAKTIELRELEGAGDYADLVAEIDRLSDEEVRALLDREASEAQ